MTIESWLNRYSGSTPRLGGLVANAYNTPSGGIRGTIYTTAKDAGIDPYLALATVENEGGFYEDPNQYYQNVGDSGQSYGPYQEHVLGRGAQAPRDIDPVRQTLRFAADIKRLQESGFQGTQGQLIAAAQRPYDPIGAAHRYQTSYDRYSGGGGSSSYDVPQSNYGGEEAGYDPGPQITPEQRARLAQANAPARTGLSFGGALGQIGAGLEQGARNVPILGGIGGSIADLLQVPISNIANVGAISRGEQQSAQYNIGDLLNLVGGGTAGPAKGAVAGALERFGQRTIGAAYDPAAAAARQAVGNVAQGAIGRFAPQTALRRGLGAIEPTDIAGERNARFVLGGGEVLGGPEGVLHADLARQAGTDLNRVLQSGAVRVYNEGQGRMAVQVSKPLNPQQAVALQRVMSGAQEVIVETPGLSATFRDPQLAIRRIQQSFIGPQAKPSIGQLVGAEEGFGRIQGRRIGEPVPNEAIPTTPETPAAVPEGNAAQAAPDVAVPPFVQKIQRSMGAGLESGARLSPQEKTQLKQWLDANGVFDEHVGQAAEGSGGLQLYLGAFEDPKWPGTNYITWDPHTDIFTSHGTPASKEGIRLFQQKASFGQYGKPDPAALDTLNTFGFSPAQEATPGKAALNAPDVAQATPDAAGVPSVEGQPAVVQSGLPPETAGAAPFERTPEAAAARTELIRQQRAGMPLALSQERAIGHSVADRLWQTKGLPDPAGNPELQPLYEELHRLSTSNPDPAAIRSWGARIAEHLERQPSLEEQLAMSIEEAQAKRAGLVPPAPAEAQLADIAGGGKPPDPPKPTKPEDLQDPNFWDQVVGFGNLVKTLRTFLDDSLVARQGIYPLLNGRYKEWGSATKASVKALFSPKYAQAHYDSLIADPFYKTASEDMKVFFPTFEQGAAPGAGMKEEAFILSPRERTIAGKIAAHVPGVQMSERAAISFLNELRLGMAKTYYRAMGGELADPKDLLNAGKLINWGSGRGPLPFGLESATPLWNNFLFSPRLLTARPATLASPLLLDGKMRALATKELAKAVVSAGSMLALASQVPGVSVERDPISSDFLKIKVGNRRYDILGGFQQPMVTAARLYQMKTRSSTTGKVTKYQDIGDPLYDFMQNKLSPALGEAGRLFENARGKKPFDRPVTVVNELRNTVVPMITDDFWTALEEEGAGGLPWVTPEVFGVGYQKYDAKSTTIGGTTRTAPPLTTLPGGGSSIENFLSKY